MADATPGEAGSVTEWGARQSSGRVRNYGSDEASEKVARMVAVDCERSGCKGALIRRTVTYGPWTEATEAASLADERSALASADNAIGQVLRHAWSWQEQGGILEARHVAAILLDVLDAWTGRASSDEGEALPLVAELEGQLALPGVADVSAARQERPWPYDGPEGRARLTGSLDTGGSFTGDDDDPEEQP